MSNFNHTEYIYLTTTETIWRLLSCLGISGVKAYWRRWRKADGLQISTIVLKVSLPGPLGQCW